jgi:hypothetical protein
MAAVRELDEAEPGQDAQRKILAQPAPPPVAMLLSLYYSSDKNASVIFRVSKKAQQFKKPTPIGRLARRMACWYNIKIFVHMRG